MPSCFRSPAHLTFPAIILVLASALVFGAAADNFSGLKGETLKESSALADLARELLSAKKAKIESAQVIEDRADSLIVRVAYKDLESAESMFLSVSAEDAKRKTLNGIEAGKAPLTATEGEITVKLQIKANVPRGTKFDQSFLVVSIGKEDSLKKAAIKVFQCSKKWEKSLAPEEMKIDVVAEPIGKSRSLAGRKSPTIVLNPRVFVTAKPLLKPAGEQGQSGFRIQPEVRKVSIVGQRLPSSISGTDTSTTVTKINPSLIGLNPANLVIGLPKDIKDNNGQGPSANAIRLFDMLSSDIGLTAEDVVDLHPN
ncbi:MAG: hypothetical protein QME62_12660, partial [Armatimonadota bacterium]|nr:hypothetical protein [Armatimonadota bacterium]